MGEYGAHLAICKELRWRDIQLLAHVLTNDDEGCATSPAVASRLGQVVAVLDPGQVGREGLPAVPLAFGRSRHSEVGQQCGT